MDLSEMARKHYAKALTSNPDIQFDGWMEGLRAQHEGAVPRDHVHRIGKTVLRKANPEQYLLSHATIVASVDTHEPKGGVSIGRRMHRGMQIDVRYPDFRIEPEGFPLINNNGDGWSRPLLLSTYRTFIGAQNYCEHVQLPELSKGFIVDAIARDLGPTCYIDILVATDRKHTRLVSDILSGSMYGLSMGTISLFTVCTECGNVAADDTQLCPCVIQGKGRTFLDDVGVNHPVAELIGHVSVPNSNQFIEASWVKAPAFTGAVRRNFLNPDSPEIASDFATAARIHEIRLDEQLPEDGRRAASRRLALDDPPEDAPPADEVVTEEVGEGDAPEGDAPEGDAPEGDAPEGDAPEGPGGAGPGGMDLGGPGGGGGGGAPSPDPAEEGTGDTTEQMVDTIKKLVLRSLIEDLTREVEPKPEDVGEVIRATPDFETSGGNDNVVRSSLDFSRKLQKTFPTNPRLTRWAAHAYGSVLRGRVAVKKELTASDLIVLSWVVDRTNARTHPSYLYKVAMSVGPVSSFPSETSYLAMCRMKIGRELTAPERRFLTWKGRIASLAEF